MLRSLVELESSNSIFLSGINTRKKYISFLKCLVHLVTVIDIGITYFENPMPMKNIVENEIQETHAVSYLLS